MYFLCSSGKACVEEDVVINVKFDMSELNYIALWCSGPYFNKISVIDGATHHFSCNPKVVNTNLWKDSRVHS